MRRRHIAAIQNRDRKQINSALWSRKVSTNGENFSENEDAHSGMAWASVSSPKDSKFYLP